MTIRFLPVMFFFVLNLGVSSTVSGQDKKTEKMMQDYLKFYFPTTGESTYEIAFDWGTYTFVTGPGPEDNVHHDSEPYRGYIAARPDPLRSTAGDLPSYLITPDGTVWIHQERQGEIPAYKTREEVTVEKNSSGTMTSTVTIHSPLEALVDHFKTNPEAWNKYGKVTVGKRNSLTLEK